MPFGFNNPSELPTSFNLIRNVVIDSHGYFKYIAIDISDRKKGTTRTIVRGQRWEFNEVKMYNSFINLEL